MEDQTTYSLLGYKPDDRIDLMKTEIIRSTTMRFAGIVYSTNKINMWEGNSLSRIPSNFLRYVNVQSSMCPQHPQMRLTSYHFNYYHRLSHMRVIPTILDLLNKSNKKKIKNEEKQGFESRIYTLNRNRIYINKFLALYDEVLKNSA